PQPDDALIARGGSGKRRGYARGMASRRMTSIVALGGLSLAAAASAASAPPRPYAAAATKACLTSLPHAVVRLPPAPPPAPPPLFLYSFPPQHVPPPMHEQLGAWYGQPGTAYSGVTLGFFKTAQEARGSFSSVLGPRGGKLIRNVVVSWDLSSVPPGS